MIFIESKAIKLRVNVIQSCKARIASFEFSSSSLFHIKREIVTGKSKKEKKNLKIVKKNPKNSIDCDFH